VRGGMHVYEEEGGSPQGIDWLKSLQGKITVGSEMT